jgi:hypothetical protein
VAYDHVYRRRDKILETVEKRLMPPWKAVPGDGDLTGERRLSTAAIATVARWVAAGAPEGDPRDLPPRVSSRPRRPSERRIWCCVPSGRSRSRRGRATSIAGTARMEPT